jgi:uncharacterized membrane protein
LCTFIALNGGQISVVAPLINTTPLFATAFTALFLRGEEKITPMVLIAVLLLVAWNRLHHRAIAGFSLT